MEHITNQKQMIFKVSLDKKIRLINLKGKETIEELRKAISESFKMPLGSFEMSYIDQDGDEISLADSQDFSILLSYDAKTMKIKIQEIQQEQKEEPKFEIIQDQIEVIPSQEPIPEVKEEHIESIEVRPELIEINEEQIEEKFRKLLPEIISRVKTEIQEEMSERSMCSSKLAEPIITEDKPETKKQTEKDEIRKPKNQKEPVLHRHINCDGCSKKGITGIRYKCAVCADFDFCEECQATIDHPHPFLKIKTLEQTPLKIFAVIKDEDNNIEVNGHKIPSQDIQNLITRGADFVSNLFGQNFRGYNHCPFRNRGQRNQEREQRREGCHRRKERRQEKVEEVKKEEKPVEKKEEAPKTSEERPVSSVNEETILENARYMSECGFDFDKCYQYASNYPTLSKEELLNNCFTHPEVLQE